MVAACIMMYKAGASKATVFYTALLTVVMTITVSLMMSMILTGDIHKVSFVGAGGALGLMLGAVTSAFIHNDHAKDSTAAWIIASPLMYGLSKIACHIAGCCNGIPYDGPLKVIYQARHDAGFFPVQLTETVVFTLIFIIGLVLFFKVKNRIMVAAGIFLVSGIAKDLLEFLRESHIGQTISSYQIIVLTIAIVIFIVAIPISKKLS